MKTSMLACVLATVVAAGCATYHERYAETLPPLNSPGAKFTILPSVVQRTVTAMDGASEIKDINKVGQDIYVVEFANPVKNPDLYVNLDGTLVRTNANIMIGPTPTGRTTSGLIIPAPVQKTLDLQAPRATIANIEPHSHTIYEVIFVDPNAHPKMLINENGTVLKEQ